MAPGQYQQMSVGDLAATRNPRDVGVCEGHVVDDEAVPSHTAQRSKDLTRLEHADRSGQDFGIRGNADETTFGDRASGPPISGTLGEPGPHPCVMDM